MLRSEIPIENLDKAESFIFVGVDYEKSTPYLMLDRFVNGQLQRLRFSVRDMVFSLIRFKAKFCAGRYNILELDEVPCPNIERIEDEKANHCIPCFREIGFNPFFYNTKDNRMSAVQTKYNSLPHNVYLAYFGKDTVKVGISSSMRTQTRLLEQGARAAFIVKHCNSADSARDYEDLIHTQLSVPEVIRSESKRNLLKTPYCKSDAEETLSAVLDPIQYKLNIQPDGDDFIHFDGWYFNKSLHNLYSLYDMTKQSPQSIGGRCVGIVGKHIIFEDGGGYYVTNLDIYRSHKVKMAIDHIVDLPVIQRDLFSF